MNKFFKEYVNIFCKRWDSFKKYIFNKETSVFGPIKDYYWRVEYQLRGTGHIHLLLWIDEEEQQKLLLNQNKKCPSK